MDIDRYTYCVTSSQQDNEHVGLCAEFPALSWLAPTPDKALAAGIGCVVKEIVDDLQAGGEAVPVAQAERQVDGPPLKELKIRRELH